MMKEPLIRMEGVSFDYRLNSEEVVRVLRDVSLDIYPGEYVAIIGHNGSGKSTLAKHFNGILKPTEGNVYVAGFNTKDDRYRREIRRRVGMVFQHPDNQIVATIVEDDVAFGLENIGVPPREMRKRIDAALEAVGMSSYRNRPPHHLSGGQKQRVAIAGVLAMEPRCLVLDEATSMLDAHGRREILQVLRRLHQRGMTIIAVSHHMSEAAEADRVLVIEAGRIAMEGPPREIFQRQELLRRLQLDIPVATRLAGRIHERVPDFQPDLIHPREIVDEVVRIAGKKGAAG
ncbi:MAG: energy-coupling factor transporter ATPase [Planifilum sp.]